MDLKGAKYIMQPGYQSISNKFFIHVLLIHDLHVCLNICSLVMKGPQSLKKSITSNAISRVISNGMLPVNLILLLL